MGIHDREYYRHETRGSGWLSGTAPVCRAIIAANVAVFVLQKLYGGALEPALWASRDQIFGHYQVWRLLTAAFVHDPDRITHILFNMLFLWFVGREMESVYGSRDFAAFYLSAAVVSNLIWTMGTFFDPFGALHRAMGASGAVMAVVVLFTLYFPRREILLLGLFPVEMWFMLVIYLGFDALSFLTNSQQPIGFAAHLGGAAFGYLYKTVDLRLSTFEKWAQQRRRPRLRIVAPDPREAPPKPTPVRPTVGPVRSSGTASTAAATRPAPVSVISEEQIDEKLDEILIKIARDGRGSLNDEDNRILDEASRRARDRRSERI